MKTFRRVALFLILSTRFAGAETAKTNLVVISDIDDTIKISRMRAGWNVFAEALHVLEKHSFSGMPELYNALSDHGKGMKVGYISAAIPLTAFLGEDFVKANEFPNDFFQNRKDIFTSVLDYKVSAIATFIRSSDPKKQFILLGDNGEHDPEVFNQLMVMPDIRPRLSKLYIHRLYSHLLKEVAQNGQVPFLTTADLAQRFFENQWITERQLVECVTTVKVGLTTSQDIFFNFALPEFAEIADLDVDKLFGPPLKNVAPDTLKLLADVKAIVQKRVNEQKKAAEDK